MTPSSLPSDGASTKLRANHLGSFEVICRIACQGGASEAVTGVTLPPAPRHGLQQLVRRQSRASYGRPVAAVDEEVRTRRLLHDDSDEPAEGTSVPKLGAQEWSGV